MEAAHGCPSIQYGWNYLFLHRHYRKVNCIEESGFTRLFRVVTSFLLDSDNSGMQPNLYFILCAQLACAAPLIYTLLLKCANVSISAPPLIFVMLLICTSAEFFLAFYWDHTLEIFGAQHSVVLMILLFIMSTINATSNVLFMPYMAAFHPNYLTAYFVGMGLSSLIPSVVSLIQGRLTSMIS